jgi:hypothetical protein
MKPEAWNVEEIGAVVPPDETITTSKPFQLPKKIKLGEQRKWIRGLLRSQKARDVSFEAAVAACDVENQNRCDPPLKADELEYRRWWDEPDRPGFREHAKFSEPSTEGATRLDPAVLCDATVVAAEGRALAEHGVQYLVDLRALEQLFDSSIVINRIIVAPGGKEVGRIQRVVLNRPRSPEHPRR